MTSDPSSATGRGHDGGDTTGGEAEAGAEEAVAGGTEGRSYTHPQGQMGGQEGQEGEKTMCRYLCKVTMYLYFYYIYSYVLSPSPRSRGVNVLGASVAKLRRL